LDSYLQDAVEKGGEYDEVLERFGDKLGAEARAIVRGLIAARKTEQGQ